MKHFNVLACVLTPLIFVAALGLSGCSSSSDGSTSFTPDNQVGTWDGQWNNTTFSTTGAASAVVSLAGDVYTITLDLGGLVFGLIDPVPEVFTANVAADSATLVGTTSPVYGDVTGMLSSTNMLTINGQNVAGLGGGSFVITGTWTATTINLNVNITFGAGGNAAATATLTKQ